jgi:hypothetical protein
MSENEFNQPINPYAQPSSFAKPAGGGADQEPGLSYVKQINVIAILTLVQGGLLLVMGIFYSFYAVFVGNMQQWMPPEERARMQEQGADFGFQIIFWAGIVIGSLVFLCGILHIIAGYRNLKYRGRIFSIVTWILGLGACLTCYCLPTSIGLLVYGLIIYLNPATARAFELRESGLSKDEIDRKFY